ncbi:MAG: hypothetical protein PHX45_08530 [Acidobacteriota bacterium]|nr:hypothetical protein [Acidobacteriota bacterium]
MRNQRKTPGRLIVGLVIVMMGAFCAKDTSREIGRNQLVGVKIYEYSGSYPRLFDEWKSLGINAAFVGASLASNPEFRGLAEKSGVSVFIIFPVFHDPGELSRQPGLSAITASGQIAREAWVQFACPTRRDYLTRKVELAGKLVRECRPEGLSLDFVRYFVFWEMVHPERKLDSLPNSCFCPSCLAEFQEAAKIRLPTGPADIPASAAWIIANHLQEWADWKCRIIAGAVKELADEARKIKPDIKINVHTVPWRKGDMEGAIRIIAGQDLAMIAPFADYLSPMCYHHMVMRPPAWVHSVVEDADVCARGRILPSIQVDKAYIDAELTVSDFKEALIEALKPPSRGVVFWSWPALEKSEGKKDALRDALKK